LHSPAQAKTLFHEARLESRRKRGKKNKSGLTLSLCHFETLSESQRRVTGLTASSRRAKSGKMLRLINNFNKTISKRLSNERVDG
jgi:hypothetical protein